jgi:ABC-type xylose transport system permease subunit
VFPVVVVVSVVVMVVVVSADVDLRVDHLEFLLGAVMVVVQIVVTGQR